MIFENLDSDKYRCPMAFSTAVGMPCLGQNCAAWREHDFKVPENMGSHSEPKEVIGFCGLAGPVTWKRAIDRAKYAS